MLRITSISLAILSFLIISSPNAANSGQQEGGDGIQKILKANIEHPFKNQNEECVDVEEKLTDYQDDRGWSNVYKDGKFRVFMVATYPFPSRNPKRDKNFVLKRNIASAGVQIFAKTEIIKSIRTNMSASDQLSMPGTDINKALNKELSELNEKRKEIEKEALQALEQVNSAEADRLSGVNWEDRTGAFADALITQLDSSYDKKQIEAEKVQKVEKLTQRLSTLKAEQKELREKADKMKVAEGQKTSSSIQALAKMPLYGIMLLATEESWCKDENGVYEVGILAVWSQKHEMRTRALLTGNFANTPASGNDRELRQWLRGKKKNLANMIGGSNFTDSNGVRWIVGASMSEIRGNNKKRAKLTAKLLSRKEVAVSLFSEVESEEFYESKSQEITTDPLAEKSEMVAAESYAATMRQSFKNRDVSGIFFIKGKTLRHPFTKKKVYVAISATSTLSNRAAFKIEKINYQTNLEDIANQQYQKGVKQGLEQKRGEAKRDKSAHRSGVRDGAGSIKRTEPNRIPSTTRSGKASAGAGASQGGDDKPSNYSAGSRAGIKNKDF